MNRELLILRHGKSDWSVATNDFQRPLKERGKRAAQQVGCWLRRKGRLPDRIISSPAVRACHTAEKCCKVMGRSIEEIVYDRRIYLAQYEDLIDTLRAVPRSCRRVMLVGHNPGLESLLLFLADSVITYPADGKLLPTGTVARLRVNTPWHQLRRASASLLQIKRPGDLPDKFPYPPPNGPQRRDRPAYYYTQSAILPYRIEAGKLRVLIVGSSQAKHWVIPKGIVEPGLSPVESARKEAREEAGIEGEVQPLAIGHYRYQKWGALCEVQVYAMKVTHEHSSEQWRESHRGRQWVSPDLAIELLKEKRLGPILANVWKQLEYDSC